MCRQAPSKRADRPRPVGRLAFARHDDHHPAGLGGIGWLPECKKPVVAAQLDLRRRLELPLQPGSQCLAAGLRGRTRAGGWLIRRRLLGGFRLLSLSNRRQAATERNAEQEHDSGQAAHGLSPDGGRRHAGAGRGYALQQRVGTPINRVNICSLYPCASFFCSAWPRRLPLAPCRWMPPVVPGSNSMPNGGWAW